MSRWPALPLDAWQDTLTTLHMYTQVVGKVRLAAMPMTNQWWQVPLYVDARGLTTLAMPHPGGQYELAFDLIAHHLAIRTSDGDVCTVPLGLPVKAFYHQLIEALAARGIPMAIWPQPVEVADPVPFDRDDRSTYDPEAVTRFFQVVTRITPVFHTFRADFRGKCSPVHFFWGSFDLAVSRYSGRMAPPRPQSDRITRLAYDEEVSSLGFWPGGHWPGGGRYDACFYAYTSPPPAGLAETPMPPPGAWNAQLGEFMLPYAEVAASADPAAMVLAFAGRAYEAGARLAGWDMDALAYRYGRPTPGITFFPAADQAAETPPR